MAVLTFPTSVRPPSQATIRALGASLTQKSIFDGSVQTLFQPGMRWAATLVWQNIPIEHWRPLAAFVNSLHGMAGRFTYTHPMCWRRATASIGTPLVAGGSQTGTSLATDGWPSAVATVLRAGDWFSYLDSASRPRLHQVTEDVVTSSGGTATIALTPPLRAAPPNDAAINVTTPTAVWMLATDDQGDAAMQGGNNNKASLTLEIVEALYGSGLPYSGGFILDTSELV